jgi:tryptophan-rich sensory protein
MADSDATSSSSVPTDDSSEGTVLDTGAIVRYGAAITVQMGLLTLLFTGLDAGVAALKIGKIPFAINVFLFYFLALKSRVFNPLSNQRPQRVTKEIKASDGESEPPPRKMPTWTPPGFVFPIVWILLIGPIRAVSSALVYQRTGKYSCQAIPTLMLHLSIGDVWNTINNVERRYGTSVVGVTMVWLSAGAAAFQYYQVSHLAGRLLALPLIWLTIASSLIIRTWQLNPSPDTAKLESLLPKKSSSTKTITKLLWFE